MSVAWVILFLIFNHAYIGNTRFIEDGMHHVNDPLVVATKYGYVRGFYLDNTRAFYGIPYAIPPTGSLRWTRPSETLSWSPKVLNATEAPNACIQEEILAYTNKYSEDCLYLNIYTPNEDITPNSKLPVIFIIHGGSFKMHSCMNTRNDGRFLAAKGAVVVTPNYRLGALGFLVTESPDIHGNYGILDQRLAMKFVQENVQYFGGDPEKVTIMGPSAGAQSVAIHLTTKNSGTLFTQAILQDNLFSILYPTKSQSSASAGDVFAKYVNCSVKDGLCMRTRSAEEILEAQRKTEQEITQDIDLATMLVTGEVWSPVIDGDEIEDNPLSQVQKGKLLQKPLIIGSNRDESRVLLQENVTISMEYYLKTLLLIFRLNAVQIVAKYPPKPLTDNGDQLAIVLTDFLVGCPNRFVARIARQNRPVFHYIYSFPTPEDFNTTVKCVNYSCHAADVIPAYGTFSINNISPSPEMERSSDSMLYYWLNFAHTGDPSNNTWVSFNNGKEDYKADGDKKDQTADRNIFTTWSQYEKDTGWQSLDITTPSNDILFDFRKDFCELWDDLGYILGNYFIRYKKCEVE
ncbi:cAMP-regulated D2 protein-like [Amphiura filiformis]|uniref:cAMP-regulated D2 protein-like n=1 Tax=Amphiura filiformis TaxID=82378 RepID=UPI003B20EC39